MNHDNPHDLMAYRDKKYLANIDNSNNIIDNIVRIKNKSKNTYMSKEVSVDMDESKAFDKILDRMDHDRREQEQRLSNNMQQMEQRITEERRLSEERMEKRFNQVMESLKETNDRFDKSVIRMESKFEDLAKEVKENNKYIRTISVTTILGIAAMVITIIIAFVQLRAGK